MTSRALGRKRILLVLAVIAVASSIGLYYLVDNEARGYPESLPDGAVPRAVYVGEAALDMVKSIHWNPENIAVEEAVVVEYTDGVRLWIARGPGMEETLQRMIEKIMAYQGTLPFKPIHDVEINGVRVYMFYDLNVPGKIHALWVRGDSLIWVEIPPQAASRTPELLELLVSQTG